MGMPQARENWRTREGWMLSIRPIGPGDEARWTAFVQGLSPATRYKRGGIRLEDLTPALAHERVTPNLEREFALVAVASHGDASPIVGVARCERHDHDRWEFMLVVADKWQRRGAGRRLMSAVDAEISRRGAPTLEGVVLATNRGMLDFVQRLGFRVEPSEISPLFRRVVKSFGSG
jgi:acetyltransferase